MATTQDITYNSGTDTAIVIQIDNINLSGKTITATIDTLDGVTSTAVSSARFTVTQTGLPSKFSWDPAQVSLARGIYRIQFTFTDAGSNIDKTSDWIKLLVR